MLRLVDIAIDIVICYLIICVYAFQHGYTRLIEMWSQAW